MFVLLLSLVNFDELSGYAFLIVKTQHFGAQT